MITTKHGTPVTVIGTAPPFRCSGNTIDRVRVIVHGHHIEREVTMNVGELVGYDERGDGSR